MSLESLEYSGSFEICVRKYDGTHLAKAKYGVGVVCACLGFRV